MTLIVYRKEKQEKGFQHTFFDRFIPFKEGKKKAESLHKGRSILKKTYVSLLEKKAFFLSGEVKP